jgi:hypothetical protein
MVLLYGAIFDKGRAKERLHTIIFGSTFSKGGKREKTCQKMLVYFSVRCYIVLFS